MQKQLTQYTTSTEKDSIDFKKFLNWFHKNYYTIPADKENFDFRIISIYQYCIENNINKNYVYQTCKLLTESVVKHYDINIASFKKAYEVVKSEYLLYEYVKEHLYQNDLGGIEVKVLENYKEKIYYSFYNQAELWNIQKKSKMLTDNTTKMESVIEQNIEKLTENLSIKTL